MSKRKINNISFFILDLLFINISYILSLLIRFEGNTSSKQFIQYFEIYRSKILPLILIKISIYILFKLYKKAWKYASIEELLSIGITVLISNSIAISYLFLINNNLPRSVYFINTVLDLFFIGGSRFTIRIASYLRRRLDFKKDLKKILIIGAGDAGALLIREYRNHETLNSKVIGVIDDDINKQGQFINNVPVLGTRDDIEEIVDSLDIDEIVIAMPSVNKSNIKDIVDMCKKTKARIKTVPGMYELISGEIKVNQVRDIQIEDLLGRDPIKLDLKGISNFLEGKSILITGAGGSIGSELSRQISNYNPGKLILLDIYENSLYDIQNELLYENKNLNLISIIASIRDKKSLEEIISKYTPDIIFHAAAHKHVPLMENNPKEAIKNNVFGTLNLVELSDKYKVKRFVMISTDKAVNPTNIMGASKRICEMIVQSKDKISDTEFVAVRFGNVLGSNGSVIPLFKKQIAKGGPVTVTHKDVIRYFMTIPEAVQLVIQAGSMAEGGEIFILDMGEPVKILDLAKDLIRLSGYEPGLDIPIEITGLRPGEKLYEELLLDEEEIKMTNHDKIYIGRPIYDDFKSLKNILINLKEQIEIVDNEQVPELIKCIVDSYEIHR